ncbi:MAG: hypothetical protein U1E23_09855 [Reyranellaceae bacterium]
MSHLRPLAVLLAALPLLSACGDGDKAAPTGPAVPMPQLQAAIENSTPQQAQRGMSDHTWLWTHGEGPVQIHYSAPDGRDYVWLVGERRMFVGDWRIAQDMDTRGRSYTQICLRYPSAGVPGLSPGWTCRPAGQKFIDMAEREAGDPLRMAGRTEVQVVLQKAPASLAEVQAMVR